VFGGPNLEYGLDFHNPNLVARADRNCHSITYDLKTYQADAAFWNEISAVIRNSN